MSDQFNLPLDEEVGTPERKAKETGLLSDREVPSTGDGKNLTSPSPQKYNDVTVNDFLSQSPEKVTKSDVADPALKKDEGRYMSDKTSSKLGNRVEDIYARNNSQYMLKIDENDQETHNENQEEINNRTFAPLYSNKSNRDNILEQSIVPRLSALGNTIPDSQPSNPLKRSEVKYRPSYNDINLYSPSNSLKAIYGGYRGTLNSRDFIRIYHLGDLKGLNSYYHIIDEYANKTLREAERRQPKIVPMARAMEFSNYETPQFPDEKKKAAFSAANRANILKIGTRPARVVENAPLSPISKDVRQRGRKLSWAVEYKEDPNSRSKPSNRPGAYNMRGSQSVPRMRNDAQARDKDQAQFSYHEAPNIPEGKEQIVVVRYLPNKNENSVLVVERDRNIAEKANQDEEKESEEDNNIEKPQFEKKAKLEYYDSIRKYEDYEPTKVSKEIDENLGSALEEITHAMDKMDEKKVEE